MELSVFNIKGEDTGRKVTLNDAIFGIEPNDHAIYLDVKQYLANQRQGTHKSNVVVISTLRCWLVVAVYSVRSLVIMSSS